MNVFVIQREAKVALLREAVEAHTQLTEQVNRNGNAILSAACVRWKKDAFAKIMCKHLIFTQL